MGIFLKRADLFLEKCEAFSVKFQDIVLFVEKFSLLRIESAELAHVHQQSSVGVLDQRVFGVGHVGVDEIVKFIGKELENLAEIFVHLLGLPVVYVELFDIVVDVWEVLFHANYRLTMIF